MINVKDQVYAALCRVIENVSDGYPEDWKKMPAVQYMEEDNKVYERTSEGEEKSYIRYRVDIWNEGSTSACACEVDRVLSELGLERTGCTDVDGPQSRYKHKTMRYEAIIDVRTGMTYSTR